MSKPDDVFTNLRDILIYSESVLVSKDIDVLWVKKNDDGESASGYLQIGNRVMWFYAELNEDGLNLWIEENSFHFTKEEVEEVIKNE